MKCRLRQALVECECLKYIYIYLQHPLALLNSANQANDSRMANYWPDNVLDKHEDFVPVVDRARYDEKDGATSNSQFNRLIAGEMCNASGFPVFLENKTKRICHMFYLLEMRVICGQAGPDEDGASYEELGITRNRSRMTKAFRDFIDGDIKQDWRT